MYVTTKRMPRSSDRINLQHPLCAGLRFATVLDTLKPRNMVEHRSRGVSTTYGTPTLVRTLFGPAVRFARTQVIEFEDSGSSTANATPVTALVFARIDAPGNGNDCNLIGNLGASSKGWCLNIAQNVSGITGTRFVTGNSVTTTVVGGASSYGGTWAWYAGTLLNTGTSISKSFFNRLVSNNVTTGVANASSPENLAIGGAVFSASPGLGINGDVAFAAVFEQALSDAAVRQWMNFEFPMFYRDRTFVYDDNEIIISESATADSDLTINTAGPLELNDGGITGTAESGGSVDTNPPSTGPIELSDSATAGFIPMTVENPTVIALADSAAAASVANIPNPFALSDNAFAGSKAATILNSNPGILAEGRYRG